MTESPQTLRALFESARAKSRDLDSSTERITSAYRENLAAAITAFQECQHLVGQLALFSPNEIVEDIASNDIQYLLVDYYLSDLLQKSYSADREQQLRQAQHGYEKFLETLDGYMILSPSDKKLYEQYLENRAGFSIVQSTDPTTRRNTKVARFQEEKALKQKLDYLRRNPTALANDDETLRQLYLTEIQFATHQTFQALEMIPQEMAMLSAVRSAPQLPPQAAEDARRRGANRDAYSDKLDKPLSELLGGGRGGPLLSKNGKPLQPFVLTDKRSQLQKGVFRPSHNLPTMSIDEYLEEEQRRGGIIEGGGEASGQAPEIDEDDMAKADEETMKARDWDEFTEANPKGSGNTINRG